MKVKNAFLSLNHANKVTFLLYSFLLVLLPTQLGKHYWPEYSLISGFRVDYLSPTLYVTDIIIILLAVSQIPRSITIKHFLPYLLGFLFLSLTILNARSTGAGLYYLLKVLEMTFVAWFIATHIRLPYYFQVTLYALGIAVWYSSTLAILQTVMKGYVGGLWYYLGERAITSTTPGAAITIVQGEIILRSYATFSHPNVLAGFLVIAMTILLLHRNNFVSLVEKIFCYSALVIGSLALGLTLSRISLALWGIVVFTYVITIWKRFRLFSLPRLLVFGGGILVVCGLLSSLITSVSERFITTRFLEESFIVRADLNRNALDIISNNPLLGVGLGNLLFTSFSYKELADPLYFAVQPVHNIFLYITAETGILGLGIFLWILFLAWVKSSRKGRVLLGSILVLGMFDHYFLTIQQGQLLFAFVLGYCFSAYNGNANSRTRLFK